MINLIIEMLVVDGIKNLENYSGFWLLPKGSLWLDS
jgi:hypothetical protein